jgi:hypothetical protein
VPDDTPGSGQSRIQAVNGVGDWRAAGGIELYTIVDIALQASGMILNLPTPQSPCRPPDTDMAPS